MRILPRQPVAGAKDADARAQLAFLTFRPTCITQCGLAAMHMRLTAIRHGARDITNCSVGIMMRCPCNRFAGATVTTDKQSEGGNRLVTHLGIGIGGQNINEVSYNIGDANVFVTAPLAGETMESTLADGRDRITQSPAKCVRGRIAGVMIQKEKAEAPHCQIRMAECGSLDSGDGNLLAQTRSAFLREREPSVDKIIRDFEVGAHRRTQSGPMTSRV